MVNLDDQPTQTRYGKRCNKIMVNLDDQPTQTRYGKLTEINELSDESIVTDNWYPDHHE